ncbi:BON domain-containing protein [Halomonas sp. WWR20]
MKKALSVSATLSLLLVLGGCANTPSAHEDYGTRTLGMQVEDESIESKVYNNLIQTDARFRDARISVDSYNGRVLLTGQVASEELKTQAGQIAEQVRMVRQVYNELAVAANAPVGQRMTDTWLTTKVKTQLASDESIDSGRIKVVTENSTVYLMGLVNHQEAERVVNAASQVGGIQRIVKVFEYLD